MRKTIGIFFAALLVVGLAGSALAKPSKKECKDSCRDQHKRLVDVCRIQHDPVIRGQCLKVAAARLSGCEKACNDAGKD
jgi:hypothetical protein